MLDLFANPHYGFALSLSAIGGAAAVQYREELFGFSPAVTGLVVGGALGYFLPASSKAMILSSAARPFVVASYASLGYVAMSLAGMQDRELIGAAVGAAYGAYVAGYFGAMSK